MSDEQCPFDASPVQRETTLLKTLLTKQDEQLAATVASLGLAWAKHSDTHWQFKRDTVVVDYWPTTMRMRAPGMSANFISVPELISQLQVVFAERHSDTREYVAKYISDSSETTDTCVNACKTLIAMFGHSPESEQIAIKLISVAETWLEQNVSTGY